MDDKIESTCGQCEQCGSGYSTPVVQDEAVRLAFGSSLCPKCHFEAHAVYMRRCELLRTIKEILP